MLRFLALAMIAAWVAAAGCQTNTSGTGITEQSQCMTTDKARSAGYCY
jgi:hypothetical protein